MYLILTLILKVLSRIFWQQNASILFGLSWTLDGFPPVILQKSGQEFV